MKKFYSVCLRILFAFTFLTSFSIAAIAAETETGETETCTVSIEFADQLAEKAFVMAFNKTAFKYINPVDNQFSVAKGDRVQFALNTIDYNISIKNNDEDVEIPPVDDTYLYIFVVEQDTHIIISATTREYEQIECSLYIVNPEGVRLRRGRYGDNDFIDISEGGIDAGSFTIKDPDLTFENARLFNVKVSVKNPRVCFEAKPGYWIAYAKLKDLKKDVATSAHVDEMPLYIVAQKINKTDSAVVFWEGDVSKGRIRDSKYGTVNIAEGYSTFKFDPQYNNPYTFAPIRNYNDPDPVVFHNGARLTMADEGIFTVTLANNSVLKIYTGGKAPEEVKISFVKEDDADAEIRYDKILLHENMDEQLILHAGSELDIKPAPGTDVFMNEVKAEKNAEGMVNIKVTAHSQISLKKASSGLDNLSVGACIDNTDTAEIYNLQGISVGRDASRLPAGIYIRGGKKIRLK